MTAPLLFLAALLALGYWLLVSRLTVARIAAYAALLIAAAAMCVLAFGVPRPVLMQWRPIHGVLLSYSLDEGRAIYVWVLPDASPVPLALRLAWSQRAAGKLETVSANGKAAGRRVRVSVSGIATMAVRAGSALIGGRIAGTGRGNGLGGASVPVNVQLAPLPATQEKPAP